MYLHEDASQFRATVLSCADAFGISPAFVAKDYYIVLLLSEIAKANASHATSTTFASCRGSSPSTTASRRCSPW